MYHNPHLICVAALSFQSLPAVASFDAGYDCGMPCAPDVGFVAFHRQPDSCSQIHTSACQSVSLSHSL